MAARWMLVLLLLLHPVRGVLAMPARAVEMPVSACGGDGTCCPLCAGLDTCPCVADRGPGELPEPVTPPTTGEGPRVIAAGGGPVFVVERAASVVLTVCAARAPPAVWGSVNEFLSVVCVWTI
jgi:hypothetical protein